MRVIFIDQLGCYAAVVAACLRIGICSEKSKWQQIAYLPYFAFQNTMLPGEIYHIGKDSEGYEVYTLGVGNAGVLIKASCADLQKLRESSKIMIIDTSNHNPFMLRLFWHLARWNILRRWRIIIAARILEKKVAQINKTVNNRM